MHEEISEKVIGISINAAKMTAEQLKEALIKLIAELEKGTKAITNPDIVHGKQTIGRLTKQGKALSNIEITDENIKSFESVARKYKIDYALKKDISEATADGLRPPRYLVFFKGQDIDVLNAAFKEFTAKKVKQAEKPSIRKTLSSMKELAKSQNAKLDKVKNKDRGLAL